MSGLEITQENSVLMYFQNYLDFNQNFPNEIARLISEIHSIDVKRYRYTKMLEEHKNKYLLMQNNWNDEEKEKSLNEIENLLLALENQSDLKLDIIKTMHEELTARKRQLDASYRLVMNSKINDYNGLMNNKKNKNENSSNGRNSPAFSKDKDNGSCNGKRIRRGSNKNDNESNYDDGDDHSSTQMTNDRSNLVKKKRGLKNSNKRSKYDSNNYEQTEETYCLCAQVSYGDMIACDNKDCSIQWFHFCCVNLSTKPKGRWFCPNCRGERSNIPRK